MASPIYRRPDLFPFSFASIPNFSGNDSFAKFGTTADALNYLTNLLTFQVSVSWNFSYSFNTPPIPINTYNESYSMTTNLPLFIPPLPESTNSSVISWYNSDTIGTKRVSPAARVLYSSNGPIASTYTKVEVDSGYDDKRLDSYLTLSRTGGVITPALSLSSTGALNGAIFFGGSFGSVPNRTLTSTPVNLMGTLVPYYLYVAGGPSINDFTYISDVTFNATVTPTFSDA